MKFKSIDANIEIIADAVNKMHEDNKKKKENKTSNQNNLVNELINETKVEI